MKKGMSQSRKKKLIKVGEAYVIIHLLFTYVNLVISSPPKLQLPHL